MPSVSAMWSQNRRNMLNSSNWSVSCSNAFVSDGYRLYWSVQILPLVSDREYKERRRSRHLLVCVERKGRVKGLLEDEIGVHNAQGVQTGVRQLEAFPKQCNWC